MNIKFVIPSIVLLTLAAIGQDATWIPSTAKGAFFSDNKALRTMPLTAKFADNKALENTPFGDAINQAKGIFGDLDKQVDKALGAIIPTEDNSSAHMVSFYTGTFDIDALAAKLKANADCSVSVKDGVTIYSIKQKNASSIVSSDTTYFAMPSKGVLVISDSVDILLLGIKTMQKKSPAIAADSKIAVAISKAYPAVGVIDLSSIVNQDEKIDFLNTPPPSFVAVTLRSKDEKTLVFAINGVFPTEADATTVETTLSALKQVYALQMVADPNAATFGKLLSSVEITHKGASAIASMPLTEETLNFFLSQMTSALQ